MSESFDPEFIAAQISADGDEGKLVAYASACGTTAEVIKGIRSYIDMDPEGSTSFLAQFSIEEIETSIRLVERCSHILGLLDAVLKRGR